MCDLFMIDLQHNVLGGLYILLAHLDGIHMLGADNYTRSHHVRKLICPCLRIDDRYFEYQKIHV